MCLLSSILQSGTVHCSLLLYFCLWSSKIYTVMCLLSSNLQSVTVHRHLSAVPFLSVVNKNRHCHVPAIIYPTVWYCSQTSLCCSISLCSQQTCNLLSTLHSGLIHTEIFCLLLHFLPRSTTKYMTCTCSHLSYSQTSLLCCSSTVQADIFSCCFIFQSGQSVTVRIWSYGIFCWQTHKHSST